MKLRGSIAAVAAFCGALTLNGERAAAQNWNGFYLGGSVGAGNDRSTWSQPGQIDYTLTGHGALGGLQAGYNWQNGSILAGVEGDYLWSGIKGSGSCNNPIFACNDKLNGLGSLRGRLGWVAIPSAMIYFTGGVGWGSSQFGASDGTAANTFSFNHTSAGLVLGGGVEYLLAKNWSIKGEYLHYNLGTLNASALDTNGQGPISFKENANTFKLGVNYKF